MASSILSFVGTLLHSQYRETIPQIETSFEGKTVIVTGANTGLGLETARHYTRLGAEKVIIACRTVSKGEIAKKSIEESTKKTGVVQVWQLDLASHDSVKAFAARASSELDRLDILVENAGIQSTKFSLVEGFESTISVNVISTFLLGLLLLPKLKETAAKYNTLPHLVVVSSDVHFLSSLSEKSSPRILDGLNDPKNFGPARYNTSKLLEVLFVRYLTSHQAAGPDYPVVINTVTPGFCHSELARESPGFLISIMQWIFWARTSETGARTFVLASQAGKESHGQFLMDAKIRQPGGWVLSEEGKVCEHRVWEEVTNVLEGISPGVLKGI
ncbi:short-chain dehydrogenase/reductase-like protein [Venturia nashicola]|nr:short-chain dehydrogenase/reductase-like protein [Venturia nashicola]